MLTLTSAEVLFLQEHLRACTAATNFLQYASQICSEPRCQNICQTMAREHQIQTGNFAKLLGATMS